ncbi:MAG TPA: hypothetical protein VGM78_02220 [Ilumatobacteraceae bacterium]
MPMYGANPEQLSQLGTTWEGPARQRFEEDWNTTFKTSLARLKDAFDAAGSDCLSRSQELQRVMGSTR